MCTRRIGTALGRYRCNARERDDTKQIEMNPLVGGSAAGGAGVGGIVGGKKGALIGAVIGGGAASIYEETRRR
jgi:hypothetical protein